MTKITNEARAFAQDLLHYIDASPSPWHAVEETKRRLKASGFTALTEQENWQLQTGGKYFVTRGDASIIAFMLGTQPMPTYGFHIVGAHTDSPGLRLKPHPAFNTEGLVRIGVEVYGGPILATFTDRDLSIAGRVVVKNGKKLATKLVRFDDALMRLPNLAIHMNREVNDKGLVLNKQTQLPLLFGMSDAERDAEQQFLDTLAEKIQVKREHIVSFELNVYDTQKGVFWGAQQAFIANGQLDNLASCHAAITALAQTENPQATCVCALFDHEEVGSESTTGADGSLLQDVLTRIMSVQNLSAQAQQQARANSFFISADMAHAYHPNHDSAYDPCHHVHVNRGVVIKTNVNQRYSTNAETAARFIQLCESANVPYQQYAHRSDLGCGSTIGPMIAANLGIATVDVGCPMWAMHSIRESAGVQDHQHITQVFTAFFNQQSNLNTAPLSPLSHLMI